MRAIGGLYEVCFGVPDLAAAASYWAAYGFCVDGVAVRLNSDAAYRLYRTNSGLTSLRLRHLDADHGLIRLMCWDNAMGEGVGLAGLRGHGSRWVGQFVTSVLEIANHVELARSQGIKIDDLPPNFIGLSSYRPSDLSRRSTQPFRETVIGLRQYTIFQSFWRQVLLERFHYCDSDMGTIAHAALLPSSQIINANFMIQSDDESVFSFYEDVLGLKCALEEKVTWEEATASRIVFNLEPNEVHQCYIYEDPRADIHNNKHRPGRLYLFRFPSGAPMHDYIKESQPGYLGCSLFTWRVADAAEFRSLCVAAKCEAVSNLEKDEFGSLAFRAVTPDGMTWLFQQATDTELSVLSS